MQTRRDFLKISGAIALTTINVPMSFANHFRNAPKESKRPNIILILTDDQGFGDLGFHGNKTLKTPNLDQFASEGADFTRFYVAPVCSPTRAGLLTGRYHYRTGVTNVGSCGDRIKKREVTIAEVLRKFGYATAIYGKWHLGDNYPIRPQDKGFEEAIVHSGCCLTPWFRNDPPGANYFDPFLFHNGRKKQFKGYCMDVYTDQAIKFMDKNVKSKKPFFIYLSTNTPHTPLSVSKEYSEPYLKMGLSKKLAEYYGTITNIDYNLGRLLKHLKKSNLDQNTLLIFLSDNGCAINESFKHWPLKLKGKKATVYEGGIRVPCVFRWPGVFKGGTKIDRIAAYIDIMPTILDAAGVAPPKNNKLDGLSLMPLLKGQPKKYPDRTIIIQWHQGLNPQMYRSFTVFNQKFKLVQAVGGFHHSGKFLTDEYRYELFEIDKDPLEENDVSSKHPEIISKFKKQYEQWFCDVMVSRGPDPEKIYIGSPHENPSRLLASSSFVEQDEKPNFSTGEWPSRVLQSGIYEIKMVFHKGLKSSGIAHFKFGQVILNKKVDKGITECVFEKVQLKQGSDWLEAFVKSNEKRIIPTYVDVKLKEDH